MRNGLNAGIGEELQNQRKASAKQKSNPMDGFALSAFVNRWISIF